MPARMHENEVAVDEALVRRLLTDQMPDLAALALRAVEPWGTDNAIWRLGDELVVRLPRIKWAAGQAAKEAEWLPQLAGHLSVAIPEPVAVGDPGEGYPFAWGVHRWLPGHGADLELPLTDPAGLAHDTAKLIAELRSVPVEGAPPAHNRARPIAAYDQATRRAIDGARDLVDAQAALAVWEAALDAQHSDRPVWVHGDLEGNCLVDSDSRLVGVVDWGSACAGDPAVDVQVAWSRLFDDETRATFLADIGADSATIARAQGAAVNQACAALPYYRETYPLIVERSLHKLHALGIETRI